jgi:hypothetical protein
MVKKCSFESEPSFCMACVSVTHQSRHKSVSLAWEAVCLFQAPCGLPMCLKISHLTVGREVLSGVEFE